MQRLEVLREAVGTAEARETRYVYSTLGKLTQVLHSDGTSFAFEYGEDGTLKKLLNSRGEVLSTLVYNVAGQLIGGESSDKIKTKRTYTPQGRIKEEVIHDAWGSYTCSYYYDRLGRIRFISLPGKESIEYDYIGTRQKAVRRTGAPSPERYRHEFTKWDARGQPIEEKLITGEVKQRTYSEDGALSSLSSPYLSESILNRDQLGNPTLVQREQSMYTYAYDHLNQLVEEKSDTKNETYCYDLLGNVRQHNENRFSSNALNQLASDLLPLSYDEKGNVIEKGSCAFTYNQSNQLIEAKDVNSGKTATYRWDVHGRRVTQVSDKSVYRHLYIGNSEIGSINQYGIIQQLKIPERVGDNEAFGAVGIEIRNKFYLPISDLFGNIVKLVDLTSKKVIESYEYTAYGQERILKDGQALENSTTGNPWRYRALRTDPMTHLVQFTFRDYSPELQHFLTADPTGYADGPNLYAYARSNPIAYCDLDGLEAKRGACLCHGTDCEYYKVGKCGHDAGILIEEDAKNQDTFKVKEWIDYEQRLARTREHRDCKWPVNYSQRHDLQRETVPGKGIGFINGVANTFLEATDSAIYVSHLAGDKNVHLIYAASNGLIPDVKQAAYNLYGHHATNATKLLHDSWTEYFKSAGADAAYLQVCHSWGAIHVRNALTMSRDEMRKRIYVVAIAPGGYIDLNICKDVIHYINADPLRDAIPHLDQGGLHIALEQDTVIKVNSLPKEPYFNHSFQSPTYESPLSETIDRYLTTGKLR